MINRVVEVAKIVRELPAPPIFFGTVVFAILALLLYLTLRIDRD